MSRICNLGVDSRKMGKEKEFLFEGPWDKFYIKEHYRCVEVVAAMTERIQFWDKFPVVDVALENGFYYVIRDGNHTSLSHYIMDAPLKCNLVDAVDGYYSGDRRYFPIGDAIVRDFDIENLDDLLRMADVLNYFSRDRAVEFCLENNLNPKYFLSQ